MQTLRTRGASKIPRSMTRPSPIGALLRGVVAGTVGAAALDSVNLWHYRRGGGKARVRDWELSRGLTWADAPAPAQVGRRAVEGVFKVKLPDSLAPVTANLVHWGYGMAWGALFGLVEGSLAKPKVRHGIAFGTVVWLTGYVVLPLAGLYRPLWTYDAPTLGWDWAAHLAYGLGAATTLVILDR